MNERIAEAVERARRGGAEKYHQKLAEQGKLFVRERLRLLFDDADAFVEDGLLTQAQAGDLPADGVVTGVGDVGGRAVAVMANDPTVKAGSLGAHTVEQILPIIELVRMRRPARARRQGRHRGGADVPLVLRAELRGGARAR